MSEHIDDIETALRTPEPALADDDFSASVLARLPPRRRRSPARRWTLAGAAALGSVLTLALSPPLERVIASLTPWSISPLVLSTAPAVAVVLIPARIVLYAERADR